LKEESDKKLAEEISRKEREAVDSEKNKKEWESTMSLIRTEAKAELDAEMAKLLKEKEDLLAQLQNAKAFGNNNFEEPGKSVLLDGIEYPDYWCKQVSDYQTFDVSKHSAEYKKIAGEFHKGLPGQQITRIERSQNKTLWMWYYLRRQTVAANNNSHPNELFLYHGSRNDAYNTILKDGLDHRVANLGGAIGAGIYFATSSATSSGYVSSTGHHTKKMLYCRVTLGSVGQGQSGLRRPPEKSKGKLFDSVGNTTMYVIFDNFQSYPEYVIHFH